MARVVDISAIGGPELREAFARLERNTANKVARKGMRVVGRLLLDATRALVPFKSGRLKRSLKLRALRRSRKGFGVRVATGSPDQLGLRADRTGYYPMSQEAGWKERDGTVHPARPYLRRAFDENKERMATMLADEIGKAIDEEWNRGK